MGLFLCLPRPHQPLVFLGADALFCGRTPLYARRLHVAGDRLPAVLAGGFGLVAPDLGNSIAPETPHFFRIRRPDLLASWTAFLKHDFIVSNRNRDLYEMDHTTQEGPSGRSSVGKGHWRYRRYQGFCRQRNSPYHRPSPAYCKTTGAAAGYARRCAKA